MREVNEEEENANVPEWNLKFSEVLKNIKKMESKMNFKNSKRTHAFSGWQQKLLINSDWVMTRECITSYKFTDAF